jgi:hypothetical protein
MEDVFKFCSAAQLRMATMDTTTRTIKIMASGQGPSHEEPLPSDTMEGGAKAKTRRKRKYVVPTSVTVQKEGGSGGGVSPGTMDQLSASHVPGSVNLDRVTGPMPNSTGKAAPVGVQAPSALDELAGGAKPRIVLAKSKKKAKIILAASRHTKPFAKRKTVKKVNVSLSGLTRKLHRANKIQHSIKKTKLEDIKAALVKAELVKSDTKAPEDVLRQMYSDYMVLKRKAL